MTIPGSDGTTRAQHIRQASPPNRDPNEYLESFRKHVFPYGAEWMWWVFQALSASRPSGPSGPSTIPLTEIEAWGRLHDHRFNLFELDCIREFDAVWLDEVRKHNKSR